MGCLPILLFLPLGGGIGYLLGGQSGAVWGAGIGLLLGLLGAGFFIKAIRGRR